MGEPIRRSPVSAVQSGDKRSEIYEKGLAAVRAIFSSLHWRVVSLLRTSLDMMLIRLPWRLPASVCNP